MRRAERRDTNEVAIVEALEGLGCRVWRMCKDEAADLLVFIPGALVGGPLRLVEVKEERGRLTRNQCEVHAVWPVHIIRTVDQAIGLVIYARGRLRRAKTA